MLEQTCFDSCRRDPFLPMLFVSFMDGQLVGGMFPNAKGNDGKLRDFSRGWADSAFYLIKEGEYKVDELYKVNDGPRHRASMGEAVGGTVRMELLQVGSAVLKANLEAVQRQLKAF